MPRRGEAVSARHVPADAEAAGCPVCESEFFVEAPGPDETLCCSSDECGERWRYCQHCETIKPEEHVGRYQECKECVR